MKTKCILLSAFSCNPYEGSEASYGWNWSVGLIKEGFEVHTLTRIVSKNDIERHPKINGLNFHYIKLPLGIEKFYSLSQVTMYLYYILWQWKAYKIAIKITKKVNFTCVHHVSWGSIQQGSFLYKLKLPFIFGPSGGGQKAVVNFRKYFSNGWQAEIKREKVARLLIKFNPAFKKMVSSAMAVWVSNPDTFELVKKYNAKNVYFTLDAALPTTFFPQCFQFKVPKTDTLKLLWVGRMMPRKGILLILDVMEKIKAIRGITLSVVGDGEQRNLFLEAIKSKGLEETVSWKGKVDFEEVKSFYKEHDIFFFTSLRDSCPAQLIEAMAYGMPVVTLNLHGQAIIVNEETGFRCSANDPETTIEELKDSILKLYNNNDLVKKMSNAAYDFALKQTWESKIRNVVEYSYPLK